LKVIGATAEAQALLDKAGVVDDEGILIDPDAVKFIDRVASGRLWERETGLRTTY